MCPRTGCTVLDMETRTLGRTGVKVSPLCLGAMMFGAWGKPDHDDCDPHHPPRRSTPGSTSSTPPTCTRTASRRRSSARRCRRAPRRRRARDQGARPDGRRPEPGRATRGAGSCGGRDSLQRLGPTRSTSTRSTAPTRRPTSTRRSARSPTSCAQGKVRYIGTSTFPAGEIVEAQWVARSGAAASGSCASSRRIRSWRADRADVLPTCQRTAWASSCGARSTAAGSRASAQGRRRLRVAARAMFPQRYDLRCRRTSASSTRSSARGGRGRSGVVADALAIALVLEHPR